VSSDSQFTVIMIDLFQLQME